MYHLRQPQKKKQSKNQSTLSASPQSNESDTTLQMARLKEGHIDADHVMMLQRTIGNQATRSMVSQIHPLPNKTVQRLPSSTAVKTAIGEPKADKTVSIFGKKFVKEESTRYRVVLTALDGYNTFILNAIASLVTLPTLMGHYNTVEAAIQEYIASKKKGRKVAYFKTVLQALSVERAAITMRASTGALMPKKWFLYISNNMAPQRTITNADVTGGEAGGSRELETVTKDTSNVK